MAELLGIVAGGAGLASLALQLVDGGQKLRQRYKNVKGLGGNILWLSEDIELIGKQLIQLETSADDIMQEQLGPIMMGRCRDRSARVADRLANLAGDIPVNSSRRQIIRTTFRSGQWKGELDELQALVTGLKQDISQYAIPLPAVAALDFNFYTRLNDGNSKTITNLIQLFVSSFRTNETSHSAGLVPLPSHCYAGSRSLTCSSLLRQLLYLMERGYVGSVDSLAAVGCDFKTVVPTLSSWPTPFIYQDDPFNFQRMKAFIGMGTDFGDSPPLHTSTLFASDETFMLCLERNTQPLDTVVNFLGQSALHMAVQQPSRVAQLLAAGHQVDQSDKYGRTPLLYAAAMNIPDTAMVLVENGANLFSTLNTGVPIICIVAARQNWTLVWRIIDFAAASHPDLTPHLIKDLLKWNLEEEYCVAHGQHDLIDFWSRVISKLGSPNFSFQDGKTLMHMTHGVRSARALIKLGFTKFKQTKGDLLEHIASLHDLPLFRFAITNGGDAHLHKVWGWRILDMLLRDLARNHIYDTECHSDFVSDVDNDRFWDIAEQISIDELKKEMEDLATKAYSELKIEIMARLRGLWRKECAEEVPPKLSRSLIQRVSRHQANDLKELLKVIRVSSYPSIPEPFSSSWGHILREKIESSPWSLDYDLEVAVIEFGVGLYRCGGDQFESWIPLLTQLTDILLAEEPEVLEP
ncbi:hypothetical protein BFJ72_g2355 [Fusarium proliferatum]|uniref:Uncharacterized protein n=1 Tax=Gibberella intermedia TaxID=948311 RepID=A0A420U0Q7_GIBIN|nr:hypothetical protein BFJ72_g2355 [Fusarium proliferatum]